MQSADWKIPTTERELDMYILKNVGNQMVLVKIDFHMDKTTFQIQHTFLF